jgi:hypothetical protein
MTDGHRANGPGPGDQPATETAFATPLPVPPFAHASEAEMARILDFYAVRWIYEPRTFPILWNLDGAVVESFAPDFYLPDLDMYLEMTTLKQRLVRKKNRKLRRLRELYPDLRIKLFYARDFRALMLKYGKLALAGELSGTLGQVGSARDQRVAAAAAAASAALVAATVEPAVPLVAVVVRPPSDAAAARRSRSVRRRRAATARAAAPVRSLPPEAVRNAEVRAAGDSA